MSTNSDAHIKTLSRLNQLVILFLTIVGVLLILASLFPLPPVAQTLLLNFGLALTPAGIVSYFLSKFASDITAALLRETITNTIKDRIQEDMANLNKTVESGIQDIGVTVKQAADQIGTDMKGFSPLFSAASRLGLENIHLTRGTALTNFAWFLDGEIQKAERGLPAQVWIASSSIKGFLEATAEHFDGRKMMERITRCGCNLRIMMTDPRIADLRAKQEQRADGEIPKEVEMNLAYLKRIGVRREVVRYYSGTPTVFAIATSDRMLLNPYPYQREAFRCFSIIVQKTINPDADIYHQYLVYHFEEPWQRTTEVPADYWARL